jgi:hypothetical protein
MPGLTIPVFELWMHGGFYISDMIDNDKTQPVELPEGAHLLLELSQVCESSHLQRQSTKLFESLIENPETWDYFLGKSDSGPKVGNTEMARRGWELLSNCSKYYPGQTFFPRNVWVNKEDLASEGHKLVKYFGTEKTILKDIQKGLADLPNVVTIEELMKIFLKNDADAAEHGAIFLLPSCGDVNFKEVKVKKTEQVLVNKIAAFQRAAALQAILAEGKKYPPIQDMLSVHNLSEVGLEDEVVFPKNLPDEAQEAIQHFTASAHSLAERAFLLPKLD